MDIQKASKERWTAGIIIGASTPVILMITGILMRVLGSAIPPIQYLPLMSPNDTTIENLVFIGGLYLALPCGLLTIIAVIFARPKGLLTQKLAITGIMLGALGILSGLLMWLYYYMIVNCCGS